MTAGTWPGPPEKADRQNISRHRGGHLLGVRDSMAAVGSIIKGDGDGHGHGHGLGFILHRGQWTERKKLKIDTARRSRGGLEKSSHPVSTARDRGRSCT